MKKAPFAALLASLCLLTGCAAGGSAAATPEPTPSATAVPTPTPTPGPVAFETVLEENAGGFSYAADYDAVSAALAAGRAAEEQLVPYGGQEQTADDSDAAFTAAYLDTADVQGSTVCTDGSYLYLLSGSQLTVLTADGANMRWVAGLPVGIDWVSTDAEDGSRWGGYEKHPVELFCAGTALAVLSDWYGYDGRRENGQDVSDYTEYMCVDIYDVSDPASPVLTASFAQDGLEIGGRISGGTLYVATLFGVYGDTAGQEPADTVPALYDGETKTPMAAEKILLAAHPSCAGYTVVCAYDLASGTRADGQALLGISADLCMDGDNLLLLDSRYAVTEDRTYPEDVYTVTEYACAACTDFYRVTLADGALALESGGTVPGAFRSVTGAEKGLLLSAVKDNYRYAVYQDETRGFVNYKWGERETGKAAYLLTASSLGETDAVVPAGYLYPWSAGGKICFAWSGEGNLKLSLYDDKLTEAASRTFGDDYSDTMSSPRSFFVSAEDGVVGFAADDGYSVCRFSETDGFQEGCEVFLQDWPWNARCVATGGCLYVADTKEVFAYSLADLTCLNSLTL